MLIDTMKEEKSNKWEEVITPTDLTHNSRKAWQTYQEAIQRPTLYKPFVSGQCQPSRTSAACQWSRNNAKAPCTTNCWRNPFIGVSNKWRRIQKRHSVTLQQGSRHIRHTDEVTKEPRTQVLKKTAYKRWNCQVNRPANYSHLHPPSGPSQFAAAKLTHYSTMPHRLCNRCSGWVHSKCSGLQNVAEYWRIKNWTCSSWSSPPIPPAPQPLPSQITTKPSDGNPFIILQFSVNDYGNKQVEIGKFLERHKLKLTAIQES